MLNGREAGASGSDVYYLERIWLFAALVQVPSGVLPYDSLFIDHMFQWSACGIGMFSG